MYSNTIENSDSNMAQYESSRAMCHFVGFAIKCPHVFELEIVC